MISHLEKSFFGIYFSPLSETKVDHYTDNKGDYLVCNRMAFLEYISYNRDRYLGVVFTDRQTITYAEVPE